MGLYFYSTTISCTFKSATNSGTFESTTIILFAFFDDLGNFKKKKLVALSKVLLIVALLNVRPIVVL